MWYLYELRYSDVPFYVGISHNPEYRYATHIFDAQSRCYNFIRFNIMHFDKYPDIKIIDCHKSNAIIRDMERAQIHKRTQEGINLLNLIWVKLDKIVFDKYSINIPKHILESVSNQTNQYLNSYV